MPRTPTLENPFAPEKRRSSDDPALVGKILGPDAEAAMRKTIPSPLRRGQGEVGDELTLTPDEQAQAEKEKRERSSEWKMEQARTELLAWAEEIGKDEEWARETFTIHQDGTLTVEEDLNLEGTSADCLPKGLKLVKGNLNLSNTKIASLDSLPAIINGDLNLHRTCITSLDGLPKNIGGSLDLSSISITSLQGLPAIINGDLILSYIRGITSLEGLPTNIGGSLHIEETPITSFRGCPTNIGGDLCFHNTPIRSLDDLPPPANIKGKIHFENPESKDHLRIAARKMGYKIDFFVRGIQHKK